MGYHWRTGYCFLLCISYINSDVFRGCATPCEGLGGAGGAPSEERDVKGTRDDGETTETSLHQVSVTAARERVSLVRVAVSLFPNETKGQL